MNKQIISLLLLTAAAQALADNVKVINPASQPVFVTQVARVGATTITPQAPYAAHITTSTTVTPTATTAYLNSIVITTTTAGTTWALKIQDKGGTPKAIYNIAAVAVGTVTIPLQGPLLMTGGIDIITTGGTPGVLDVFLNYSQ